jgi:hypothetical protein
VGKGGYRCGAGRPGWRCKVEHSWPLDVRRFKAHKLLNAGIWFGWGWNRNGEPCGSVGVTMFADSMRVDYRLTRHGETRELRTIVSLVRIPCRFGGARTLFLCPDCHRRCLVVYGFDRFGSFSCRRCMNLAYASEAEDTTGRLWRKERKLEAKLSEDGQRRKGMHWRTFDRICNKLIEVEVARDREFTRAAQALLQRLPVDDQKWLRRMIGRDC